MSALTAFVFAPLFPRAAAATSLSPCFPHVAASSAPSSFSQLLPLVVSPAASCYSVVAPIIHFCGFSGGGSSGFYSALPCIFCLFSCPVFHRIHRFSPLCFLGQLALVFVSPPLCASLRFSSLQLWFLLCCYAWLSLGVSTAFCCLCIVRISGSLRDMVSLWDESGFAEVSLSFSRFSGLLPVVVSLSLGLHPVPLLLCVSGSSSYVIAFWVGSCFTWCSIWLWCLVPSYGGSFSLLVPVSLPFLGLFLGSVQRLRSSVPRDPHISYCVVSTLHLLFSVRPSFCLRWPFLSVSLPLLSQVACGSFPWVCDSFASKVSRSNEVARWVKSLLFLLDPSPSPPGALSVFPGCPKFSPFPFLQVQLFLFVFCPGWFSFFLS